VSEQVLDQAEEEAPPVAPPARPVGLRRPSPSAWAIGIGAFLVATAVLPELETSIDPEKAAVLAVLGAAGLPMLVARALGLARRSRSETIASRFALAFVVASGISTAVAVRPVLAMVGLYNQFDGWFFLVALAGCWALGTAIDSDDDRRLLEGALIAAALVNALMALLQQFVNTGNIALPSYSGIPDDLLGNPVYLCSLLAASLTLLGPRFRSSPRQWWLVVGLIALGLGVGSERLGAVVAVAVVVFELWIAFRSRRPPPEAATGNQRKRALGFAALVVGGLIAGSLISRYKGSGGGVAGHFAATSAEGTYGQRFGAWQAALRAIGSGDHWLFGYGPGQFRSATATHFSLHSWLLDPGAVFTDSHNIFLELATTTGIIGLLLIVAWVVFAFRNRTGRLLGFAAAIFVTELVEPINLALTPLAFLALGGAAVAVAGRRKAAEPSPRATPRWVAPAAVVTAALALIPALMLVIGDESLTRSAAQFSVAQDPAALSSAGTAETMLSPWPEPATHLSQIHQYLSLGHKKRQALQAIAWAKVAAERDPTNPYLLTAYANSLALNGQLGKAKAEALLALKHSPYWSQAMNLLSGIAYQEHHPAEGRAWLVRSLRADPEQGNLKAVLSGKCPPPEPGRDTFTKPGKCFP